MRKERKKSRSDDRDRDRRNVEKTKSTEIDEKSPIRAPSPKRVKDSPKVDENREKSESPEIRKRKRETNSDTEDVDNKVSLPSLQML